MLVYLLKNDINSDILSEVGDVGRMLEAIRLCANKLAKASISAENTYQ